ncbi:uncharacterized protein [Oscarella lobularis]|uniref:uncharacterized protein isoform X2 n=1 Tax=Oscarella lobularis TaxID=121494 RepID=UPI0033144426
MATHGAALAHTVLDGCVSTQRTLKILVLCATTLSYSGHRQLPTIGMKNRLCEFIRMTAIHVIWLAFIACAAEAKVRMFITADEPFYASSNVIVTTIKCATRSKFSPCSIKWRQLNEAKAYNGIILSNTTTTNSGNSSCLSTLTLRIRVHSDAPPNPLPSFQCQLNGENKGDISAISRAVQPKQYVQLLSSQSEVTGFLRNNVTIRCPLANHLPPTAIGSMFVHWWHLNSLRKNVSSIVDSFSLTLSIYNITTADEGWYECRPIGYGNTRTAENSSWVRVIVKGRPDAPVHFRIASSSNCSKQPMEFVWDEPRSSVSEIEVNCSFRQFITPYHSTHVFIHATSGGGHCKIRFRNPAGPGYYSHSIPVCVLKGRIRKHVEIITGILGTLTIIAGGMILFFFCGGRRFLGVISFKCQPTQSEVLTEAQHKRKDSDQSQSLVQVPRQKLEEILTVCKETNRCVQEVLDKDTAEADNMNAVNEVQCASSTANSHREAQEKNGKSSVEEEMEKKGGKESLV